MRRCAKTTLILMLILLVTPLVFGQVEECKRIAQTTDVPCRVTSPWNYTKPCSSHQATVFDDDGENVENYTYTDYGNSSNLCLFDWFIDEPGSYTYTVDTGDTGNIIVEVQDNLLGIIIGSLVIIVAFIFFAIVSPKILRFVNFSIAIIELVIMVGIIYGKEAGIDITRILQINFYALLTIIFFYGITILVLKSIFLMRPDKKIDKEGSDVKWATDKW